MKTYTVRTNCEYSVQVVAEDEEQAIEQVRFIDLETWDKAWADFEAEEEE